MRVLIVDDDQVSAELTAECLMMDPAVSVRIACDGMSALEVVSEFAPHVIFLDVHLPDSSGVALAPRLRDQCPRPDVRIVILSGTGRDVCETEYPEGVSAWLEKPVHIDTLQAFVSRRTDSD